MNFANQPFKGNRPNNDPNSNGVNDEAKPINNRRNGPVEKYNPTDTPGKIRPNSKIRINPNKPGNKKDDPTKPKLNIDLPDDKLIDDLKKAEDDEAKKLEDLQKMLD